MSKLVKLFAIAALIGGAIAVTPGSAEARYRGYHFGGIPYIGGMHFGGYHLGGFPFRSYRRSYYRGWGGFGVGPAIVLGLGAPFYYADWPYAERGSDCGWVRKGTRYHHYRVWRCW